MSGACISLVLVLSVIFLIILISGLAKKQNSYIYTTTCNDSNSIEVEVREMIWNNPNSEIVVVTYGKNQEADEILQRLKKDFPQLHIIKK